MKNRIVDNLLTPAIELVDRHLWNDPVTKDHVPKEYESALSSLGGSVIQSGPLPSLALYLKTTGSSKTNKALLAYILLLLIQKQGGFVRNDDGKTVQNVIPSPSEEQSPKVLSNGWMLQSIEEYDADQQQFKVRLKNSIIALKLALRTFPLKKT